MFMTSSWRELLGKVIKKTSERHLIAEAIGVSSTTLQRWATNRSDPRMETQRVMFEVLPQFQPEFAELIEREYPHLSLNTATASEYVQEIPSEFYARVLNAHAISSSLLRASAVSTLILQQMLEQLDPQQQGTVVFVVQYAHPLPQHKIRSLRVTQARAAAPWRYPIEHFVMFLGAESQMGHAVLSGHQNIMHSRDARERWYPSHPTPTEGSFVAHPIVRADRTAGCLFVNSPEPNLFSHSHLDLIQAYADLSVLMFRPDEFYPLDQIELGLMPSYEIQQPYLATFQQRITRHMILASRNQQSLTRAQAEQSVWREIEEELLRLSFDLQSQLASSSAM